MVNRTYNRAPIHFATEGGHVGTLRVLLAKPTNLNLQDTEQYQTALHIAVYRNDENCARLLLRKGASANIPNKEGLSAIYLAARNGQRNMVELILTEHWQYLDLDNYWDRNNQTTREVIYHMNMSKEQLMELQLMMKNLVPTRNYCDLQYYLMVSDETNFLNLEIPECYSSVEETYSPAERLLVIATRNDLRQAVTRILNWFGKIELEETWLKNIVFQAAYTALENGHYVILRILINLIPEYTEYLIINLCLLWYAQRKVTNTSPHISDWLECMKVILTQEEWNFHILKDGIDYGPLHLVIALGNDEIVSLFLKQDYYIGHMNEIKLSIVANISEGLLSKYLDDCVQLLTTEAYGRKSIIEFNYRCLMPNNVRRKRNNSIKNLQSELQVFMYIAHNSKLKQLLKHPLLSSFVYLKYHAVRNIILVKFSLYLIFYTILNGYVFCMGIYSSLSKKEIPLDSERVNNNMHNCHNAMDDSNSITDTVNSSSQIDEDVMGIQFVMLFILLIFRESLQIIYNRRYYVKEWMNGLQIMLFGLTTFFLCGARIEIGIAATLLSTWELMIVIGQISPRFSTSITIFRTVFYNFVKLFAPYMIFIVVFSMIFYVFYKESKDIVFSQPSYAFIKTILMLIGDFGIDNSVFDSHYSIWSRLVLVTFVFLIVILLMNMLNALTVSNTAEILSQAELIELIYRIELIAYFETIACVIDRLIIRYCPNIIYMKFYIKLVNRIFLFGNYLDDGKIKCMIYDTEDFHGDNYIINDQNFFVEKMDNDIIGQAKRIASARSNR